MKGWLKKIFVLIFLSTFMFSCTNKVVEEKTNLENNNNTEMSNYNEGNIVAIMKTTNGTINILLETEKVPVTTTNFIGLAKQGYYDGVIFHRIIKDFMIQWWDPDGTGMGWTSIYWEKFDDEFDSSLKNNKYTISMANAWKNTNGSQFFINTANNNFLDGKHSVFGRVVEWFDNVDKLEKTKTASWDRPVKEVKIISIDIKEFKNGSLKDIEFNLEDTLKNIEKTKENKELEKKSKILENWDTVLVDYTLTLEDGKKIDSSLDRGEPFEFTLWAKQVIKGWDEWLVWHKIGDKFKLEVSAKDAYWEYDENNKQVLQKDQLQSFVDAWISLTVWETLPTSRWQFVIIDADDKTVTIDTNHALAWKKLFFDIEVKDIK